MSAKKSWIVNEEKVSLLDREWETGWRDHIPSYEQNIIQLNYINAGHALNHGRRHKSNIIQDSSKYKQIAV